MKNTAIGIGLSTIAVAAFGYLVNDAMVFALSPADPISGRIRGCYTFIESIVGVFEPNDTLRSSQLYVGSLGVLVACGYLVRAVARMVFNRGNAKPLA